MANSNYLKNETSPYLLQHANNPVNWYPWCDNAFEKAKKENKPVFLSIGYSTCHWCHVMAHESFEDEEIAEILNKNFISIKVDKEERPDIDSIYMSVCQVFTGSGGWPTSIFMSPEQKPFYAGTYFPKISKYGLIGFKELLFAISDKWNNNKSELIKSGDKIINRLTSTQKNSLTDDNLLIENSVKTFKKIFDKNHGGFGDAPKFPTPHNLLFLMSYFERTKDKETIDIVKKTLLQMYKGGLFDHIGFGFSRYSTDNYFLVPHFEKMLYDNALLMISYIQAFYLTKEELYKSVAIKISEYILRELYDDEGGFYCAQDADSDGVEGKYYVFDYNEIIELLGEDLGKRFNLYYGITKEGNFERKNILNLLHNTVLTNEFEKYLPLIYEYRKKRNQLHLDDKILTSWNSLMILAFVLMYRVLGDNLYLNVAKKACCFINEKLLDDDTLYVSYRNNKRTNKGFLDDYAFYICALINMYEGTFEQDYLDKAILLTNKVINDFYDNQNGGFYLYGSQNQQLIIKPKETYDGAIPSGNSFMTYNLIKLVILNKDDNLDKILKTHIQYMSSQATNYPIGYSFYLNALSMFLYPSKEIVVVLKDNIEKEHLKRKFPLNSTIRIIENETKEYPLINNKTTFYVCQNYSCLPPTNDINEII